MKKKAVIVIISYILFFVICAWVIDMLLPTLKYSFYTGDRIKGNISVKINDTAIPLGSDMKIVCMQTETNYHINTTLIKDNDTNSYYFSTKGNIPGDYTLRIPIRYVTLQKLTEDRFFIDLKEDIISTIVFTNYYSNLFINSSWDIINIDLNLVFQKVDSEWLALATVDFTSINLEGKKETMTYDWKFNLSLGEKIIIQIGE